MKATAEEKLYREIRYILKHGAVSVQDALKDIVHELYLTVRGAIGGVR